MGSRVKSQQSAIRAGKHEKRSRLTCMSCISSLLKRSIVSVAILGPSGQNHFAFPAQPKFLSEENLPSAQSPGCGKAASVGNLEYSQLSLVFSHSDPSNINIEFSPNRKFAETRNSGRTTQGIVFNNTITVTCTFICTRYAFVLPHVAQL